MAKKKVKRLVTCCNISVHSVRKRMCDIDNISAKAVIDGIVHSGLLEDDSSSYINQISYTQEKGQEEQTIITLTPVKKEEAGRE